MTLLCTAGLASTGDRRPATPDTPFYLASQTKSYVGLLAAVLHRRGIFRLETKLADIWPGLPGSCARVSMLRLLTHRLPLRNDELEIRASWREHVPARDYPALLAASESREPGFRYDNLGYLAYAAALEAATGTDWRAWLARELLLPLGLAATSTRAGGLPASRFAWRHRREEGKWRALPPKADALMQAAGGLMSSPADLATWLQANLRRAAPGLEPEDFARAHRPRVRAEAADGPFLWTHYALGQQRGAIAGIPVVGHRGGYEGARSIALFSPAARVGLALAVNADHATRELIDNLAHAFFHRLAEGY